MRICLCTLILNEFQWLPKLYEQHKNWKGLVKWIFVESADKVYAQTNPQMVNKNGLSVDSTTQYLEDLAAIDDRIVHIKYGFCSSEDKAQGKCEARTQYLKEMESVEPTYFIVVDADEFYPHEMQTRINAILEKPGRDRMWGACFKHREIWYPPILQSPNPYPRFSYEVVGGFWSIPYCRVWKWFPGLKYTNHNTPSLCADAPLDRYLKRFDGDADAPYFVHMGFASKLETRAAKNRYYEERGEKVDRKRSWYCDSRKAFETWTPEVVLPKGAKVIPYNGIIPECFTESTYANYENLVP